MALSGFFLMFFLLQHFAINFLSVISPDMFNKTSHFMGTNFAVQFLLQPILLFGVVLLWKSELFLALLVATAMLLNLFVAAAGGVLVPIAMKYFKMDPASSSAVVVTTMTDIAGIVVYLGLANLMVAYI